MRKHIFTIMAIAAVLCACNKEIAPGSQKTEDITSEEPLIFTATMEGADTKAILDGMTPSWVPGDEISINAKTYVAQNAGTSSSFVPKTDSATESYGFYEAVFPADFASWMSWGGTISLATLFYPEKEETWQDGKFAMPMYAKTSGNTFSFKNLCGVLKITVKRSQLSKVKSIYIEGKGQYLSGTVNIVKNDDDSYKAVIKSDGGARYNRKIIYTTAVPTTPEGTVFYVAVPPNTFSGLTIKLSFDGETFPVEMKTAQGRDIVIERNKVYPITFAGSWAPSGTATATIGGNEVAVPWVQLWKNGPKFAKYNVGVTDGKEESLGGHYNWGGTIDGEYNRDFYQGSSLSGDNDTATKLWGENWRMPTGPELRALYDHCKTTSDVSYEKVTINGQAGYRFTGTGDYASNSIFLPLAGHINSDGFGLQNYYGYYWSTDQRDNYNGLEFKILTSNPLLTYTNDSKKIGNSVRAVYAP